ncbi:NAD-dependent epimerase/dehydratase family protein [Comamonadaceae bacterium PP-2]
MKILVTGAAGFIGYHSVLELVSQGHEIIGIDNLNDYYDVSLKEKRLSLLRKLDGFNFHRLDLADQNEMAALFESCAFDKVLHLGAQAGVRYSIDNPFAYLHSNLTGTLNVIEGCRRTKVKHLVYASSSSVYGANKKVPFSTYDMTDSPVSLYAATKKSNELMCQTYAHLYQLPCTGLRFFTVYGPWGRPDMAYFKFTKAILANEEIDVYNYGDMSRDFTYISDIVDGISALINLKVYPDGKGVPHKVYNLGNNKPEQLTAMISELESLLGVNARKRMLPMQPGDVHSTYADIEESIKDFGYSPKVGLNAGLAKFVEWYKAEY